CGTHPARFHRTRAVVWFEYIDTAPPVPYACTRYTQVPDVTVSAKVVTFGPSVATRLKAMLFFADAPRSTWRQLSSVALPVQRSVPVFPGTLAVRFDGACTVVEDTVIVPEPEPVAPLSSVTVSVAL